MDNSKNEKEERGVREDNSDVKYRNVVIKYHELGKRIKTDINFPKYAKGRRKAIKQLTGLSSTSIYYAIQFYKKYPDLETIPKGVSWHRIVTKYLRKTKELPLTTEEILNEEAHTIIVGICPICKTENDVFFVELIKHHICYKPKYTILICRSCHQKCHTQVTQIGGGI